jgi:hypothetical protein
MSIELIVRETLERKLADVLVPRTDVDEVRRAGRQRRRVRVGAVLVGLLSATAAMSTLVVGSTGEPQHPTTTPTVPQMDFSAGLRGFYDVRTGLTHLGGQEFDLGGVDLESSSATTPYGLVFMTPNQAVRVLPDDGRIRTIAAPPPKPNAFTPTLRYDPARGTVAWLTKSRGRVSLSVYEFAFGPRLLGSYPVPCSGDVCDSLVVSGVDHGLVFVSDSNGTRALDPNFGPIADWTFVTDGRVTDVRRQVILTWDASAPLPQPFTDAGWRMATASSQRSLLTFDGAYQVSESTTLDSTTGAAPSGLALPPPQGPVSVTVDSDGTVLVAQADGDAQVVYDCQLAATCDEVARLPGGAGGPTFLGIG